MDFFFDSIKLSMKHLLRSFLYALVAIFCFFLTFQSLNTDQPFYITALFALLFLFNNTLYIHAISCIMIDKPMDFGKSFMWKKTHTDFFIFVNLGLTFLIILVFSLTFVLSALSSALDGLAIEAESAINTHLDFNPFKQKSIAIKAIFALLAYISLRVWSHVCQIGVRIPAHSDGRYLRGDYAIEIVSPYKFSLYLSSAMCLGIGAYILYVLSKQSAVIVIALFPYALSLIYFLILHIHLAIWANCYKIVSKEHIINRIVL